MKKKIDWQRAKEFMEGKADAVKYLLDTEPRREGLLFSVWTGEYPPSIVVHAAVELPNLRFAEERTHLGCVRRDIPDEDAWRIGEILLEVATSVGLRVFRPRRERGMLIYELRPHYARDFAEEGQGVDTGK